MQFNKHGPHFEVQNIKELCRSKSVSIDIEIKSLNDPKCTPTTLAQTNNREHVRKDKFGNTIEKRGRQKVCFRDQVEVKQGLLDVKIVDNWKLFNINEQDDDPEICCKYDCMLF